MSPLNESIIDGAILVVHFFYFAYFYFEVKTGKIFDLTLTKKKKKKLRK